MQDGIPATLYPAAGETSRDSFNPRWTVSIGNSFTLSPTTIVNVQLGGGKWTESNLPKVANFDATTLGFPAAIASAFDVAVPPQFNLSDYTTIANTNFSVAARSTWSAQINASKQFAARGAAR